MRYDPDKHHRQSTRLRHYDYSQAGGYFVTICVQARQAAFGSVVGNEMCLDAIGLLAQSAWCQLTDRFPGLVLDEFVLMPNHLHGIIFLPSCKSSDDKLPSLGEIVRSFKAVTTRIVRQNGRSDFAWQRNYFEHVVRDEPDLFRIRQYIANNPAAWADDAENPDGYAA
jgi:putative transposase